MPTYYEQFGEAAGAAMSHNAEMAARHAAERAADDAPATADLPEPIVQATRYEVSLLPEDDINRHVFTVEVEYRGEGRWAVVRCGSCLGADGTWDFGVKEYDRGDDWLGAHRFDLDTALELAKQAAPDLVVNGHTATDAWYRAHRPA